MSDSVLVIARQKDDPVAALDDWISRQDGRTQVIEAFHELGAGKRLRNECGGRKTVQFLRWDWNRVHRVDDRLAFPTRQDLRNLAMFSEWDRQEDRVGLGKRWIFQDVHSGGAASIAGIQPGNILLSVDGREITPPVFPMGEETSFEVVSTDLSGKVPHVEYSLSRLTGPVALHLLQTLALWGTEYSSLGSAREDTHFGCRP